MLTEEKFASFLLLTLEEELDNLFPSKEDFRRKIEQLPTSPITFRLYTITLTSDQYYALIDSINDLFEDFPILKDSFYIHNLCLMFNFDTNQINFIESLLESRPLKFIRSMIQDD